MANFNNQHIPSCQMRQRVTDLAIAGIPKYLIAKIIEIDEETLNKHYSRELDCAEAEAVERIAKVVAIQAQDGDSKAQALYLKTRGAKFGWVEKQVIEKHDSQDVMAMREKIAELEAKHESDY
jgi:hypothetical protein